MKPEGVTDCGAERAWFGRELGLAASGAPAIPVPPPARGPAPTEPVEMRLNAATSWSTVGHVALEELRDTARSDSRRPRYTSVRHSLVLRRRDGGEILALDAPLEPPEAFQRILASVPACTGRPCGRRGWTGPCARGARVGDAVTMCPSFTVGPWVRHPVALRRGGIRWCPLSKQLTVCGCPG
jgi:hypothetical protein